MEKAFFRKLSDFLDWWKNESDGTHKILAALTDESLKAQICDGHRTIGRIVWHIVTTIPEMLSNVGLEFSGPTENDPIPEKAAEILAVYDKYAKTILEQIKDKWDDSTLAKEDEMYGMTWNRSTTLAIFVHHEIHHRGQLTVLMRQAGLKVPGIYGPAYEEWNNFGQEPPKV